MSIPYAVIIENGLMEVLHFDDTIYDNSTHRWICLAYWASGCRSIIGGTLLKLKNPNIEATKLYDLKHYTTMFYYKIKDILLVKQQIGHKKNRNYIDLHAASTLQRRILLS